MKVLYGVFLLICVVTASRVHSKNNRPAEPARSVQERWDLLKNRMDTDNSGHVDHSEFNVFQLKHRAYDLNHDSRLDRKELIALSGIQHHELSQVITGQPRKNTCAGKCGAWDSMVINGATLWCFCDSLCQQLGDCCDDLCDAGVCPTSGSCSCPNRTTVPAIGSGCFPNGISCTFAGVGRTCAERPLNPWELAGHGWVAGGVQTCTPACDPTATCKNGVCVPDPCTGFVCTPKSQCHIAGSCVNVNNVATCTNPTKAQGTTCDDGNAATLNDVCQVANNDATCVGTPQNPCNGQVCTPLSQCHTAGVCNTTSGLCSNPQNTGAACNDGDNATSGDSCRTQGGVFGCFGTNPCTGVVCTASDQCHNAGTCSVVNGAGVCSNPLKATGTACDDGNAQTTNDVCSATGTCAGTIPPNPCVSAADGTVCNTNGRCHANICVPLMTSANRDTIVNKVVIPFLTARAATDTRPGDTPGAITRMAFHGCGTFLPSANNGGCDYCILRPCAANVPAAQCARNDPDNNGLQNAGTAVLNLYNTSNLDGTAATTRMANWISVPDFFVLVANTVINRTSGGTIIPEFRTGRTWCPAVQPSLVGRLPNPQMSITQMGTFFQTSLGLTTRKQWYALLGAHSLGRMSRSGSGFGRSWDTTPNNLDNNFWKTLANTATKWRPEAVVATSTNDDFPSQLGQYEIYTNINTVSTHSGVAMLRSDMEMGWCVNAACSGGGPTVVLPNPNPRGCTVDHTTTSTFCPPQAELTSIVEFWADDANVADYRNTFRTSWNQMVTRGNFVLSAVIP